MPRDDFFGFNKAFGFFLLLATSDELLLLFLFLSATLGCKKLILFGFVTHDFTTADIWFVFSKYLSLLLLFLIAMSFTTFDANKSIFFSH